MEPRSSPSQVPNGKSCLGPLGTFELPVLAAVQPVQLVAPVAPVALVKPINSLWLQRET